MFWGRFKWWSAKRITMCQVVLESEKRLRTTDLEMLSLSLQQ